jgi:hypothetical protein
MDVVGGEWVKWFWGLTCDFWAENGKNNLWNGQRQWNQSFGGLGGAVARGETNTGVLRCAQDDDEKRTKAKARTTAKQRQQLRGREAAYIPPIAKCAMDGAPIADRVCQRRTGNNNRAGNSKLHGGSSDSMLAAAAVAL